MTIYNNFIRWVPRRTHKGKIYERNYFLRFLMDFPFRDLLFFLIRRFVRFPPLVIGLSFDQVQIIGNLFNCCIVVLYFF